MVIDILGVVCLIVKVNGLFNVYYIDFMVFVEEWDVLFYE